MLKRIQYVSDIHLEFHKNVCPKIKAVAPILCLAGDIGYPNMSNYKNFLTHLNSNNAFQKIFLIAGNHEYYNQNKSIEETNSCIQRIVNGLPKISFLNNKSEFYDGYLFIGSTLWSKVHESDRNLYRESTLTRRVAAPRVPFGQRRSRGLKPSSLRSRSVF